MRLSEKRRQAIYSAVHDRVMGLRVELATLARNGRSAAPGHIDNLLSRLGIAAGEAAIRAAESGEGE